MPRILVLILGALICLLGHLARAYADDTQTTVERASEAIRGLLEHPSPLLRDRASEVDEIARACVDVESRWGAPCLLLVSMMHHESRFDREAIGKLGERGLLQIHGVAARGCDLDSIQGQVECGALWLMQGYGKCKDSGWFEAMTWYASPGKCRPEPNGKLDRRISARWHLWHKLQRNQQVGGSKATAQ